MKLNDIYDPEGQEEEVDFTEEEFSSMKEGFRQILQDIENSENSYLRPERPVRQGRVSFNLVAGITFMIVAVIVVTISVLSYRFFSRNEPKVIETPQPILVVPTQGCTPLLIIYSQCTTDTGCYYQVEGDPGVYQFGIDQQANYQQGMTVCK